MKTRSPGKALIIGRSLRALVGLLLFVSIAPFYLNSDWGVRLAALATSAGLVMLYTVAHWIASGLSGAASRWLGSLVAFGVLILVYMLGSGGGSMWGQGEGQLAVLTFLGLSLLAAGWRGDPGCEVLAIPNALLRGTSRFPCLLFSPIDWVERRLAQTD